MMKRLIRAVATLVLVGGFGAVLFSGGFVAGRATANTGLFSFLPGAPEGGTPAQLQKTFAPFWQAWTLVHQDYVQQPVDDIKLMRGAIRGMLQSLGDVHTQYMAPEEAKVMASDLSGQLQGIGAEVETDSKTGYTRIIAPIPNSPAAQAGLLPDDLILTINGEDIAGQDIGTVVAKVRGPAGSSVTLTIQRQDHPAPLSFTITRATLMIASVEGRHLDGNLAYVKVNIFGEKTAADLRAQLHDRLAEHPKGLILDLRGNPGGLLPTAVDVVSQFVPSGTAVTIQSGDGSRQTYAVHGDGLATEIPLVVLIDKGSASAAEITAGAIQDHKRGTLVGVTSYGKGSVQEVQTLTHDGEVRVTIARWLTPNGRWIDKIGLTPEVVIERTEADRAANRDPQLDKAIELLTKP